MNDSETIHIIRDELNTECGLAWAINIIGCCRPWNVADYRNRLGCHICPACETALADRRRFAAERRQPSAPAAGPLLSGYSPTLVEDLRHNGYAGGNADSKVAR